MNFEGSGKKIKTINYLGKLKIIRIRHDTLSYLIVFILISILKYNKCILNVKFYLPTVFKAPFSHLYYCTY